MQSYPIPAISRCPQANKRPHLELTFNSSGTQWLIPSENVLSPGKNQAGWKKSCLFFPTSCPSYIAGINLLIRPGIPGQDRVPMTRRTSYHEVEPDEEFFFNSLEGHGRDPSLFSLWQLLNATPLPSLQAVTEMTPETNS